MNDQLSSFIEDIGVTPGIHSIEEIKKILSYLADRYPFENTDVLLNNHEPITTDFLINKHLVHNRGGLCYELNPLLYLILKELGYDVHLAVGTTASQGGSWNTDRTHVLNIVDHQGQTYVADAGYGNNLSRQPLEIDGPPVESSAGCFRVVSKKTSKGNAVLEMKAKEEWQIKYAFHIEKTNWTVLDRIKAIITKNKDSTFNQQLLISKCLQDKTLSINESRLRFRDGQTNEETDVPFRNEEDLLEAVKEHASPGIFEKAREYIRMVHP